MRDGYVYIVQALASGPIEGWIKIGWAKDIARRMVEVAATCGSDLTLLGSTLGTQADEGVMQRRFATERIAFDWFVPSVALLAYASGLPSPIQISRVHSCTRHAGAMLRRLARASRGRRGMAFDVVDVTRFNTG